MATDGRGGGGSGGAGNGRPRRRKGKQGADPALGLLRHQARTLALQALYEVELTGHEPRAALAGVLAGGTEDRDEDAPAEPEVEAKPDSETGTAVPPAVQGYVEKLVHGVMLYLYKLDPLLVEFAPAFNGEQTPAVDRSVLRLATYELLYEPGVPPKVAIDEAVELAKRFGGEGSARFVNGVLGRVLERREEIAAAAIPAAGADRPPVADPGEVGDR